MLGDGPSSKLERLINLVQSASLATTPEENLVLAIEAVSLDIREKELLCYPKLQTLISVLAKKQSLFSSIDKISKAIATLLELILSRFNSKPETKKITGEDKKFLISVLTAYCSHAYFIKQKYSFFSIALENFFSTDLNPTVLALMLSPEGQQMLGKLVARGQTAAFEKLLAKIKSSRMHHAPLSLESFLLSIKTYFERVVNYSHYESEQKRELTLSHVQKELRWLTEVQEALRQCSKMLILYLSEGSLSSCAVGDFRQLFNSVEVRLAKCLLLPSDEDEARLAVKDSFPSETQLLSNISKGYLDYSKIRDHFLDKQFSQISAALLVVTNPTKETSSRIETPAVREPLASVVEVAQDRVSPSPDSIQSKPEMPLADIHFAQGLLGLQETVKQSDDLLQAYSSMSFLIPHYVQQRGINSLQPLLESLKRRRFVLEAKLESVKPWLLSELVSNTANPAMSHYWLLGVNLLKQYDAHIVSLTSIIDKIRTNNAVLLSQIGMFGGSASHALPQRFVPETLAPGMGH